MLAVEFGRVGGQIQIIARSRRIHGVRSEVGGLLFDFGLGVQECILHLHILNSSIHLFQISHAVFI